MSRLIHILRYNLDSGYRQRYNNRIRFMKILLMNKSIVDDLVYKEKIEGIAS